MSYDENRMNDLIEGGLSERDSIYNKLEKLESKISERIEEVEDHIGNFALDKVTEDCLNNEINFLKSLLIIIRC